MKQWMGSVWWCRSKGGVPLRRPVGFLFGATGLWSGCRHVRGLRGLKVFELWRQLVSQDTSVPEDETRRVFFNVVVSERLRSVLWVWSHTDTHLPFSFRLFSALRSLRHDDIMLCDWCLYCNSGSSSRFPFCLFCRDACWGMDRHKYGPPCFKVNI